jgi:prefoldin subunit 5
VAAWQGTTADERAAVDDVLDDKRRRLGTALHQLACELAEARQQNRQLQRELQGLRAEQAREPTRKDQ